MYDHKTPTAHTVQFQQDQNQMIYQKKDINFPVFIPNPTQDQNTNIQMRLEVSRKSLKRQDIEVQKKLEEEKIREYLIYQQIQDLKLQSITKNSGKNSNVLILPQLTTEKRRPSAITKLNIQITKSTIHDQDRVQSALIDGKRYQDFLKGDEKNKYDVYKGNIMKIKQEEQLKRISTIISNSPKFQRSKQL
ncbi:UNKNOWN [Stylonychia lemnae]|uniref:Uncharacterized protein n=1 Tax=Stylonychia lemnae TaxID=5949 RepID=A0A078BAP8_STYLE|nr:UNKNOWN [Stylonychia lemnae]|eukprot:CDW90643.1 UNKNOWN [Stylonychia lemnae]